MLAAVFEKPGTLTLQDRPIPQLTSEHDVKIKVEAASICGTDIHILHVPPGFPAKPGIVQGHEYVGRVVEVGGGVTNVKPGDRVVIDPNITCGVCAYCQMGEYSMCDNFTTLGIFLDGGWTSYSIAPAKNVFRIADSVPPEIAVLAEPLSVVISGSEKVNAQPGDSVVIVGAGPMGQLFAQVMKAAGAAQIVCIDLSDYRLDKARESGATHVINPSRTNVEEATKNITGIGADIVIDCVGSLFDQCLSLVRKGGQILLVGLNEHALPPIKQYEITRNEITVKGTFIQNHHFPKVIKILEGGILNLEPLVTHRLPLDQIHEGIDIMKKGEAIKIVIYPE
jgi:2-desacetyl-2-hydroxyethyl bacteriochlorophyllide A dehydrogenase